MNRRITTLVAVGWVVLAAVARGEEAPLAGAPGLWPGIEARLGLVALDGTLRWRRPLGESVGTKTLGWRADLEHRVEVDGLGRPRSVWRITGLSSWLVPAGRGQLQWQPPGGGAVGFERAGIGRAFAEAGPPRWLIREKAPGEFEIRDAGGRAWHYRRGLLREMEHPSLGMLTVESVGGRIREIRDAHDPHGRPLVRADFDPAGHPLRVAVGDAEPQQFVWDAAGQLTEWRSLNGATVQFAYRRGLLSEVRETGKPVVGLAWGENPGWRRGDSKWPAPVHLASDGERDYTCRLTSRGIVLTGRGHAAGEVTTTIYNPRRGRLEQHHGDAIHRVWFRTVAPERGRLERVESGSGEVLEEYRYDARGRLVALKRQGEPERLLTYDESGRLMQLAEKEAP